MIQTRKAHERGQAHHGWLNSQHTFSFGSYFDPAHMGFGHLRVINEDKIDGGTGFQPHSHKNMEIISYVIGGALEHKDSMGNTTLIQPGEVQLMGAGTGVTHSEMNHKKNQTTHFLQIWILPKSEGGAPRYEQKDFKAAIETNDLTLVISPSGRDGSLKIQQEASIWIGSLNKAQIYQKELNLAKGYWLQNVRASLKVNGYDIAPGDAISFQQEPKLEIECLDTGDFLFFEV